MRIKLVIEYDGTAYAGWQRQENAMSVQQRLEEAIASLVGQKTVVLGASRTDAGVHALGQTAHFDTQSTIPPEKWCFALNTRLPKDIRVVASQEVQKDFHARYHALAKQYVYRIHNAPHAKAIGRQWTWHVPMMLEEKQMHDAIQCVVGRMDFACCMAAGSKVEDTIRTIYAASVLRREQEIVFTIQGDGFLYNMVRILTGTLVEIGAGRMPMDCLLKALQSGDRALLGPTAPPQGLCLSWIHYA